MERRKFIPLPPADYVSNTLDSSLTQDLSVTVNTSTVTVNLTADIPLA